MNTPPTAISLQSKQMTNLGTSISSDTSKIVNILKRPPRMINGCSEGWMRTSCWGCVIQEKSLHGSPQVC